MTNRQRFWLKVVLFIALPIWILPIVLVLVVWGIWTEISSHIDSI